MLARGRHCWEAHLQLKVKQSIDHSRVSLLKVNLQVCFFFLDEPKNKHAPSLAWVIAKVFGPRLLLGHLCKLVYDILTFVGPTLQRRVKLLRQPWLYKVNEYTVHSTLSCLIQLHDQLHGGSGRARVEGLPLRNPLLRLFRRRFLLLPPTLPHRHDDRNAPEGVANCCNLPKGGATGWRDCVQFIE